MMIGALIGFTISMVLTSITLMGLQAQVTKHNSSALLVAARGKAKLTVHWPVLVIKTLTFTSVGAVIGYFI